ncbi:hypothetical protein ACWEDZ_04370 [Streptomyces sp. NPDC005047]
MARYVAVSTDDWDKVIKEGPYELEDPEQYSVEPGQRLMPEEDALAAGYRYAEGGAAVAPGEPSEGEESPGRGKKRGHDKPKDKDKG